MIHSRREVQNSSCCVQPGAALPQRSWGGFETQTLCCDTSGICIHFLRDCMRGVLEEPVCRLGKGTLLLRGWVCAAEEGSAGETLVLGWHFKVIKGRISC